MADAIDTSRMPYQLPFPAKAVEEVLVSPAVPRDERIWVPQAEGLDFRPLLLHTVQGYWCNLLRVRRTGVVSRHRHPQPVTGYVIKGPGTTSSTTGWPSPARPVRAARRDAPGAGSPAASRRALGGVDKSQL